MGSEPSSAGTVGHPGWFSVFVQLMKLRVIVLLQITAICAILVHDLLSRNDLIDVERSWGDTAYTIIITVLGGTLSAGGSNAINMWYDSDIDPLMKRTKNRPIPRGHISPRGALIFGLMISIIGSSIFFLLSWKAAFWSFFSVFFYVIVYSIWLKRRTPQNIVIGGLAGAMPPLLGWSAVTGTIEPGAVILVLIIFAWTPPHFWALAIHRKDEYAKSGVPMLPVTHGEQITKLHIIFYTGILIVLSSMPYFGRRSGVVYLTCAMVLGAGFLFFSWLLFIEPGPRTAMNTFRYSIVYLALLFVGLLIDHYLV